MLQKESGSQIILGPCFCDWIYTLIYFSSWKQKKEETVKTWQMELDWNEKVVYN